jgi:ferritin-like metal-binding protein YciE
MSDLDGTWNVKRLDGLLPPMVGVHKVIRGALGETRIGSLVGVPFEVRGLSLHYRAPFRGFVDLLEPAGDGYLGRATFRGWMFGRFALERVSAERRAQMAESKLEDQLTKHIDEAYAMEQNVLRMLDGMIATTEDEEIVSELRLHKLDTEQHAERLRQRLEAHGATPSMMREATGLMGALMKSVVDVVRQEKAGRNARDGYATEHLEIAAYQLLERIAERAGDEETANVARQNRADEQTFAKKIEASWDRFAELALKEEGVTA